MDFTNIDIKDLACFICDILKKNGIEAVLVGGACVSIYTRNQYQSFDLDFATYSDLKQIETVLVKLNFKKVGRCFSHKNCAYIIDFVNPPIAIGNESIRNFETLKTPSGSLKLLTPTDCVKDRLASFFYWGDQQAFEQALLVALDQSIDHTEIIKWARAEGYMDKLNLFLKSLKANS